MAEFVFSEWEVNRLYVFVASIVIHGTTIQIHHTKLLAEVL